MTQDGSGTTSTDARARMVERQLRRRGIDDERVLGAMAEVPRELFVPEDQRRRAYRDGALRIGEGQTISQPWIVACMASCSSCAASETRARGRHRLGLRGRRAVAALLRRCVTIERYESLAEGAAARARRARLRQRRGARRRRRPGRARPRAVRRHLGHRHGARRAARRRCSTQLAPGAALVCPVARGRREHLMRFRDGERGGGRRGALRPAGERTERRVIREFSAGGVVVRRDAGAAVRRRRARARRDPRAAQGPPGRRRVGREAAAARGARGDRARGRARREARRRQLLVRPRRRAGDEDRGVLPVPLPLRAASTTTTTRSRRRSGSRSTRRPERLAYKGEREMAEAALSRLAEGR